MLRRVLLRTPTLQLAKDKVEGRVRHCVGSFRVFCFRVSVGWAFWGFVWFQGHKRIDMWHYGFIRCG